MQDPPHTKNNYNRKHYKGTESSDSTAAHSYCQKQLNHHLPPSPTPQAIQHRPATQHDLRLLHRSNAPRKQHITTTFNYTNQTTAQQENVHNSHSN